MDVESLLSGSAAGVTAAIAFYLFRMLVQCIQDCNHRRFRSRCCTHVLDVELDITPSAQAVRVNEAATHALAISIPPSPPQRQARV